MSHYIIAVFSYKPEDVEELLAPYNEQTEDAEYLEFEKACESIEDIRTEYELSKQDGEGFGAFVYRWYGYVYNEELGAYGFYTNPSAKWDWWEIGGRWHNELRLKQGRRCNQAQVRDVDFSQNAESDTVFTCWAFLTPDGEWHEQGQMGFFGVGDDTKESRARFTLELENMLKSSPDLWVTIVDCHI